MKLIANSVDLGGVTGNPNLPAITANNQMDAMKDFLAVYTATQNDKVTNNGSLDEQLSLIKSGANTEQNKQIQAMLFGNGTQAGGVIDKNRVLLGGKGAAGGGMGAQLSAETLAAIMGRKPEEVSDWVAPINEAITKFDINTPERLAMFLANVRAESGGLKSTIEAVVWSEAALKNVGNFNKLKITPPDPTKPNYAAALASYNAHHAQDMLTYTGYLNGSLGVGNTVGEKQANYAYADVDGNDDEASRDGYRYRGRGLLQITRKGKYERVTNGGFRAGGAGQVNAIPGLNQIYGTQDDFVANPDQILTKTNAARSSAWYWRFESSRGDLNDKADTANFPGAVRGIHGNTPAEQMELRTRNFDNAKKVLGGQNVYSSMNQMLGLVGLQAQQADGYNTKFGFALNPRTAVDIVTRRNLDAQVTDSIPSSIPIDLVDRFTQDFDVDKKEVDMLLLDVLPLDTSAPLMLAVNAPTARSSQPGLYGVIGGCSLVVGGVKDRFSGTDLNATKTLRPGYAALELFQHWEEEELLNSNEVQDEASHSTNTTVIGQPAHGKLVWLGDKGSEVNFGEENSYRYEPNKGYIGTDRVTFMTQLAGKSIKVIYYIRVIKDVIEIDNYIKLYEKYCPRATWPISEVEQSQSHLAAWQRSTALSGLIAAASHSVTGFEDLAGSSVGQTNGSGATAHITLDADAAGHGWYVDPKPLDPSTSSGLANSDFLPTSNPGIWQAKAGSAADGKMDLLSVLLHEYGHALGQSGIAAPALFAFGRS